MLGSRIAVAGSAREQASLDQELDQRLVREMRFVQRRPYTSGLAQEGIDSGAAQP